MDRHARSRRSLTHVLALFGYIVGSLLATWPLAAHITTHVTGDGIDDPALAWNLWWIKVRLVDQLQPDIFHVGWMFHPININLGFYTLTPLNGLLSIPIQSGLTLTLANNILLLTSFVLGGYGVWLLVQEIWARPLSKLDSRLAWAICWLAGAFYAFAGVKLFYASLGQFNIASSQWLPFCALYLWRTLQSKTKGAAWRSGALAGLFLLFQAWAELTYASFLLLFFALAYLYVSVAWLLLTPRQGERWWRSTQGMIAAAIVFILGIAPILIAIVPDMLVEGDFFASGGGFADVFSADLMGYLVPTRLNPWFGEWVAELPFPNDKAQHIFLGYLLMLLVALGVIAGLRNRRQRGTTLFSLLAIAFFWLLTLGPFMRWAGENLPIPGPFAIVSQLPFFSGNRYPSRYSVMLLLCAAVLASRGMIWLVQSQWLVERPRVAFGALALVAVVFTVEHLSTPLPLNDFRIPPIYQRMAEADGDFALLELPTGWRNGARVLGKSDVLIMMQQWYQTSHGLRRLGGNTSRNPEYKFQYFSETPLLANLIALMNADRPHLSPTLEAEYPAIAEAARQQAPQLFDLFGIRYLTLHMEKSPRLLVLLVEEALPVKMVNEWQGPDWTGAPSTIRLYEVTTPPPPSELIVELTSSEANMYLAEGWSPVWDPEVGRFATRQSVDLLIPGLPNGGQITLTYAKPSTVIYHFQGTELGKQNSNTHSLTLPPQSDGQPTARLSLTFVDAPTPIADLVPNATAIGQTSANLAPGVAIVAQSAGEEVGDLAHIWVNGVDYANNQRGYNLVALNPTGDVLASATFDTMLSTESDRMAEWLNGWEEGTIIVGAVADTAETDGGGSLGESAITALQQLGVAGDLRGKFRWSHAFVGVVGAPPASAIEEEQLIHPVNIWVGAPLPSLSGYGPLQSVRLERD